MLVCLIKSSQTMLSNNAVKQCCEVDKLVYTPCDGPWQHVRSQHCFASFQRQRNTQISWDLYSLWTKERYNLLLTSEVGLELLRKAFSRATLILESILVLFFLLRPTPSGVDTFPELEIAAGLLLIESASSSHFCSKGFNLHMFLKDRFKASKRDIVVWLKSLP